MKDELKISTKLIKGNKGKDEIEESITEYLSNGEIDKQNIFLQEYVE